MGRRLVSARARASTATEASRRAERETAREHAATREIHSDDERLLTHQTDLWIPPVIDLDGGGEWLVWANPRGGGRSLRPPHQLLEEFVALASAQPEQVLRFARRWGVLHLCARHQQPAGHAS